MLLAEIFEKVKTENARSKEKYGPWVGNYSDSDQSEAIRREFMEWCTAYIEGDIQGEHGEIAEATHVINVLCRRVMFLTGERDA